MLMDHAQIRVDHTGDRPSVVKSASPGPAADRLQRESTALEAAQHPGVVTFASFTHDAHGVELRTRFCGSRTLANAGHLPVERIAGMMAALATTVADLHELGVSHGRLTPDHVLIATDGRPVLCGLAEACLKAGASERNEDVAQLGALVRDLLAPHDNAAPIPDTRLGRRATWAGYHRRALLNLADQATADDPLIRPTARQLAHNLRTTVPGATLLDSLPSGSGQDLPFADDDEPTGASHALRRWTTGMSRGRPDRLTTLGAGAAGIILVATVGAIVLAPDDPAAQPDPHSRATSIPEATSTTGATETSIPSRLTTTTSPPTLSSPPTTSTSTTSLSQSEPVRHRDSEALEAEGETPDSTRSPGSGIAEAAGCSTITGDSDAALASGAPCPVTLAFGDGVLTVGDDHFELGLADAAVAIGDFGCTGSIQAAVLDRARGDVYVFSDWASSTQSATTTALRRIEAGSRLLAEPGTTGCHRLVALDTFGIRHLIDAAPMETP